MTADIELHACKGLSIFDACPFGNKIADDVLVCDECRVLPEPEPPNCGGKHPCFYRDCGWCESRAEDDL